MILVGNVRTFGIVKSSPCNLGEGRIAVGSGDSNVYVLRLIPQPVPVIPAATSKDGAIQVPESVAPNLDAIHEPSAAGVVTSREP